jgi:MoxR-like ATPase
MPNSLTELERKVALARRRVEPLLQEVGRVIVGLRPLLDRLLIGLLTDGHILIEGVPGLAKTLAVRTLAGAMQLHFHRIQFTPDLLPADIIGTLVFNPRTGEFTVRRGPIFAQVILADEINRSPAKVQSALLEAMQERQVTIGDETFSLAHPFLVLATQNPIEHEGTYPLPEAQVDRFMMKVKLDYPSREEELEILDRMGAIQQRWEVQAVFGPQDIDELRSLVDQVYVSEKVNEYMVDLVRATRRPQEYGLDLGGLIDYGASPRATIFLKRGARALAFLDGRAYITPDDVKALAPDVLRHRIILTYEAEAEGLTADGIISRILSHLPVP